MSKRSHSYLVDASVRIATVCAKDDDAIVYIPRMMAQASFPSRKQTSNEFTRFNGRYQLSMLSPSNIGLPYGMGVRDLICYITTRAKIKKSREIYIGKSISDLTKNLGKASSGGSNGSITALREQCKRLFSTSINWIDNGEHSWSIETLRIAKEASILWEPKTNKSWESYLLLEEAFYEDIQTCAIPIDKRVKDAFCHYPLAFDSYCWLTYRFFNMHKPSLVTWKQLENQFGNIYCRHAYFKSKFKKVLDRVLLIYPRAKFSMRDNGILLYPSPPHIRPNA